jgi:hypothetical protein
MLRTNVVHFERREWDALLEQWFLIRRRDCRKLRMRISCRVVVPLVTKADLNKVSHARCNTTLRIKGVPVLLHPLEARRRA